MYAIRSPNMISTELHLRQQPCPQYRIGSPPPRTSDAGGLSTIPEGFDPAVLLGAGGLSNCPGTPVLHTVSDDLSNVSSYRP